MAFEKKNWLDRDVEYPGRRLLTPENGATPTLVRVERDEGLVYEEGDPFDAATMNEVEERVARGFEQAQKAVQAVADAAGRAQERADSAHMLAQSAKQGADTAGEAAGKAQNRADSAHSLATAAQGAANSAATAAGSAQTRADNAYTLASSANGTANTANSTATTALGRANTANTAAGTAQTRANNAYTLASAALPKTGGTLTGRLTMGAPGTVDGPRIRFNQGSAYSELCMMDASNNWVAINTNGEGVIVRNHGHTGWRPVYASNTSQPSSRRYKCAIEDIEDARVEALYGARVRSFRYSEASGFDDGQLHCGLIAEELAEIDTAYVYRNVAGEAEGINYPSMVPPLLRLVQKQHAALEKQGEALAALQTEITELRSMLANGACKADREEAK